MALLMELHVNLDLLVFQVPVQHYNSYRPCQSTRILPSPLRTYHSRIDHRLLLHLPR